MVRYQINSFLYRIFYLYKMKNIYNVWLYLLECSKSTNKLYKQFPFLLNSWEENLALIFEATENGKLKHWKRAFPSVSKELQTAEREDKKQTQIPINTGFGQRGKDSYIPSASQPKGRNNGLCSSQLPAPRSIFCVISIVLWGSDLYILQVQKT